MTGQLLAAYAALEQEVRQRQTAFQRPRCQATITTAVAWQFTQSLLASVVPKTGHPSLVELSTRVEQTPQFLKYQPWKEKP